MSRRLQQVNKYRNAVGKIGKKEEWYADLPIGTSSSSDKASLVQVSNTWMAVKWSGNGGSIGLLPLDRPGKTCAKNARVFNAHAAPVSDWQFSPFDDNLLATGGEDGTVKLWRIPQGDNATPSCLSSLTTPSRRVDSVVFHPAADQILSNMGNDGKKICIWDLNRSSHALEIVTDKEPFQSFSWKSDGSLMATSSKECTAVWDPRASEEQPMSGAGHEGIKGARIIWLGDSNYLFSVGMTKFRSREYALWDVRNLSAPIKKTALDTSTGVMQPMYDEDTETIYLLGRGDATVRSMQISDLYTGPSISENMPVATTMPVYGATLLRKQTLDVMHAEIARVLAVVDNNVVPVSYQVPRKQFLDFHAELFPDTKGNVPALSSEDWLSGKNALVAKISLDPAKRATLNTGQQQQQSQQKLQQTPAEITPNAAGVQKDTVSKEEPVSNKNAESKTGQAVAPESAAEAPSPKEIKAELHSTATDKSTPSNNVSLSESNGAAEPAPSKSIRKFGPAEPSVFKYIDGKLYHPSKHYDDLQGLSIDKSGNFDLIQANARYIGVPLSGPGGRVGIILAAKTGRLPLHIPSVLCGSPVTNFRFDPFSDNTLATASEDNKIRLWKLPENGLEEDLSEASVILSDPSMDKVSLIEFHPNAQDVILSVSHDLGNPTLRIWDIKERKVRIIIKDIHGSQAILFAAWSSDGSKIATHAKDKQLRIIDARSGKVLAQAKSHEGIRPSRVVFLNDHQLASIGFGLGSMREILVFDLNALDKPVKRNIDVSPSVMSMHFDSDCQILYAAGRGDRIIHTYALESSGKLDPLAKIEAGTLQQGLAFLPKRTCDVANIEIARFYRLTPTSIEPYGIRVPRARPEYFQDDIFIDTPDVEHPAQDSTSWFDGKDVPLRRISLKPDNLTPLSQAPPPPQQAKAKAKFEMGKKMVSDEERRQQLMDRMFSTAKDVEGQEGKQDNRPEEEKEVADDEWDD